MKEDKENMHPTQILGMQKTIESNIVAQEERQANRPHRGPFG